MTPTPNSRLIGIGNLNWRRYERVSDRYGSICLYKSQESEETVVLNKYHGYGKLTAIIKEIRPSNHIGDMFRGLHPSTPQINDTIELGEGELFYNADEFGEMVGLKPNNSRTSDWLNPKNLYKCHNQTVELWFEDVT